MLPKIDVPSYDIVLPVSKTKVTFRPFLVKEQKILLMAMESEESDFIESNIKQILRNCSLTELNIDNLPLVDIEFYFLNLRAKSVGEEIETKYKCENVVDEKPCDNIMNVKYNVLEVDVKIPEGEPIIKLAEDIGIKMKYPSFAVLNKLKSQESASVAFELIAECIEYVYDKDNLYYTNEIPKEELEAFLDQMTTEQFKDVQKFIEELPRIEKTIDIKCSKCGFEHKIVSKELTDFFS
jgi:hypothetical protein